MRSLVLCPYLPDVADHGGRIRSGVLVRALARLGPVVLAAPLQDPRDAARADGAAERLGVEIRPLPAAADRPSALGKLRAWTGGRSELLGRRWTAESRAAAAQLVAESAHDLLVVDSSHCLPLVPEVIARPLAVHFHNVESSLLGRADAVRRSLAERVVRKMEALGCARAEGEAAARAAVCVTTSALDRQRLLALEPGAAVEVVENSIDIAARPLLPPHSGEPRILFVGSFEYPPNREAADELVRQHFPELRRAHPGLRLRLVGSGSVEWARARGSVDGLEVGGRVDDLLPHYRASSAVYLPIRSGGGTRIKVIEAFAVGRPVLSTGVGVEGLGLEPRLHYLEAEDPRQGREAFAAVLGGGAEEMIARCRALVEQRWTHDVAVANMARILETAPGRP